MSGGRAFSREPELVFIRGFQGVCPWGRPPAETPGPFLGDKVPPRGSASTVPRRSSGAHLALPEESAQKRLTPGHVVSFPVNHIGRS